MTMQFVYIPKWKIYLYDLARRVKLFKNINLGKISLGLRPGEMLVIKKLLKRFGKEDSIHEVRSRMFLDYVLTCEENYRRVSELELKIAIKLSDIKKLKLEELFMEISEMKKFGREVGLTFSDMKGLDEESLIYAIVGKVDPKRQYNPDFVEWYESLDEKYFKDGNANTNNNSEEVNMDELIEAIEDSQELEELKEILEMDEYDGIFSDKTKKFAKKVKEDDIASLQEKMLEDIEASAGGDKEEELEEEKPKGKKDKKEKEEVAEETEDVSIEELKEFIEGCEDLDELKGLVKEYPQFFEGVSTRGKIKLETLQASMLEALSSNNDEGEEEGNDIEKMVEEWEAMSSSDLRKLAKERNITVKIGTAKDKIIELLVESYESGGNDTEEIVINQTQILEWVKNKDLEALNKAAEDLGVGLNSLQSKNAKRAGDKLLEFLSENKVKEKKEVPTKKEKKEAPKKETIFNKIETMVENGDEDDEIVKAVYPMLKEKGLSLMDAKKKVKQLIEVARLQ